MKVAGEKMANNARSIKATSESSKLVQETIGITVDTMSRAKDKVETTAKEAEQAKVAINNVSKLFREINIASSSNAVRGLFKILCQHLVVPKIVS